MIRNRHAGRPNHDRWLVSYADFITLLFAFFVVLYASAQVDQRKIGKLAQAIQGGFQDLGAFSSGGGTVEHPSSVDKTSAQLEDFALLRAELERTLAPELARNEAAIHQRPDELILSLREVGFFNSGSAGIRHEARGSLDRIARVLGRQPYYLRIEGHTDNVPIHNGRYSSNWELSTARATEVVRILVLQYEFQPENLAAAGYAEYRPEADNNTDQGRQANRRVDIVVLTPRTEKKW